MCPVPVAVLKAIEVEAGLALPKDVTFKLQDGKLGARMMRGEVDAYL